MQPQHRALHLRCVAVCIAGTWRTGNMLYFNVIILMAVAGFVTCIACFFMGAVGSSPPHVRHPRVGRVG